MTTISSGTFVASLLGVALDQQWASLVASFIALVVTAMNLGTKNFKHGCDRFHGRQRRRISGVC